MDSWESFTIYNNSIILKEFTPHKLIKGSFRKRVYNDVILGFIIRMFFLVEYWFLDTTVQGKWNFWQEKRKGKWNWEAWKTYMKSCIHSLVLFQEHVLYKFIYRRKIVELLSKNTRQWGPMTLKIIFPLLGD